MSTAERMPATHNSTIITTARLVLSLFQGRQDLLAVYRDGHPTKPARLTSPLTPERFARDHLSGRQSLGLYFPSPPPGADMTAAVVSDCVVRCSCIDIDSKPIKDAEGNRDYSSDPETWDNPQWRQQAESIYFRLCDLGLSPLVEISQSGNAVHVWLFFDEDVPAWLVREFWQTLGRDMQVALKEIFPKSDRLAGEKVGNLVRYPLWGKSRFVSIPSAWATLDTIKVLERVKRTNATALQAVAKLMRVPEFVRRTYTPRPISGTSTSGDVDVAEFVSALQFVPNDGAMGRDDWVKIGMAIKATFPGNDGLAMFIDFSIRSPRCKSGGATCEKMWPALSPTVLDHRHVFKLAYAAGWQSPLLQQRRSAFGRDNAPQPISHPAIRRAHRKVVAALRRKQGRRA